ncbi:hypothetical protein RUM44_002887 [Polyplax serrata]|uniref:Uncharacterized protein n=1 Tax=Polyplax serrata TaxID=468196 RepID=A0ABR1AWZ0_POLSC
MRDKVVEDKEPPVPETVRLRWEETSKQSFPLERFDRGFQTDKFQMSLPRGTKRMLRHKMPNRTSLFAISGLWSVTRRQTLSKFVFDGSLTIFRGSTVPKCKTGQTGWAGDWVSKNKEARKELKLPVGTMQDTNGIDNYSTHEVEAAARVSIGKHQEEVVQVQPGKEEEESARIALIK